MSGEIIGVDPALDGSEVTTITFTDPAEFIKTGSSGIVKIAGEDYRVVDCNPATLTLTVMPIEKEVRVPHWRRILLVVLAIAAISAAMIFLSGCATASRAAWFLFRPSEAEVRAEVEHGAVTASGKFLRGGDRD